jgi:3-deoxy-7-phosphoheptulonate synthase
MFEVMRPVIKVLHLAGQFTKPDLIPTETQDGVTLHAYYGDMINGLEFTADARTPNAQRMVQAYSQAGATLNLLRAFANAGYADLHRVHTWNIDFMESSPQGERYRAYCDRLTESLDFMAACGLNSETTPQMRETEIFTCHDAVLLPYEQALTHQHEDGYFDNSAHMLCVGSYARDPGHAHVEFLRGVSNPIGILCDKDLSPEALLRLLDALNPENEPGRITLICGMGESRAELALPPLIRAVHREGREILWVTDPMSGNTIESPSGYKTRMFDRILSEIGIQLAIHAAEGSYRVAYFSS